MKFLYSSCALWNIFATLPRVLRLEPTIWRSLKAAGIAKLVSRRGCRAGRSKQRPIMTVLGYGKYHCSNLQSSANLCLNMIYPKFKNGFLSPYMQISSKSLDRIQRNNASLTSFQPPVMLHQPRENINTHLSALALQETL